MRIEERVNYCKGICPVCGGETEYTEDEQMGDASMIFGWRCLCCGADGIEYNTLQFSSNEVVKVPEKE